MRTIAHISDVHFGAEDPLVAEGLIADLISTAPSLVVVSGDLTQRAKRQQFIAARAFLDRIPFPQLIVPGNHDIPFYDLYRRVFRPLHRYRHYITPDLSPMFVDEEMAVLGINTARADTLKNGRVSLAQIKLIRGRFLAVEDNLFKVLVTHHPFIPPPQDPDSAVVGRRNLALDVLEACGCELLLAGHLHMAYSGDAMSYHVGLKRTMMVAQAGTAISHRRRGEPNAYNLITLAPPLLTLHVRTWDGAQFAPTAYSEYSDQGGLGWVQLKGERMKDEG